MAITGKTGVLLVNLGTPDAPTRGAVYRYLKEFLMDGRVVDINPVARNILVNGIIAPFRSGQSAKAYKELWTEEGSPLKIFGEILTANIQDRLGDEFDVRLAMRYQSPSIKSVLQDMLNGHLKKIIVMPLFPQYASATTGSVHEEVMRILSKEQVIPDVKFINSYYDHPKFIEAFVERGKEHDISAYDHILFSYHGLPKRQLRKADKCNHCFKVENCCESIGPNNQYCYSAQCYATTEAIAKALNLSKDQYSTCFQSRLGRDPWLEPYTSDMLKTRYEKGDRKLLVFCPAFVADCLETTIEISDEYAEEFEEMGGEHLQLVEGLNDHPKWIEAVYDIIMENV
jgi:ferrochelatase